MLEYEAVVKDINEGGETIYKDGEPVVACLRLNCIPRQHDLLKIDDKYYEVVRVVRNLDSWNDPVTIVARKYIMVPKMILSGRAE